MTQKIALEVKPLASPCYEAIKTIAGERECPECDGHGLVQKFMADGSDKPIKVSNCPTCNGTGKVGWKWVPEVGEWCICEEKLLLVNYIRKYILECEQEPYGALLNAKIKNCIPILPWETIEKTLKGLGYRTGIAEFNDPFEYAFTIESDTVKAVQGYSSKSRTRAVYEAVIELGKEI